MENGPLLILGGPKEVELAIKRSSLENRAALIGALATPRREAMAHVSAIEINPSNTAG